MDRLIAAVLAGITDGASFGLVALGIVLVYKATRVLNFAQVEIGTLAIYLEWQLWRVGVPVGVAMLLALVAAALMGAGTEVILRPLANAPRLTLTVATLGIATFLGFFQVLRFNTDPHNAPSLASGNAFTLGGIEFAKARVLALFVTAILGIGLYLFFKRTLFGLGVLAAAQDQKALRLMGIPLNAVSTFTWATGAALTALAGLIIAPTIGSFTPFFMTTIIVPSLAAALVGGLTSLPGAFVGGLIVGIAYDIAKFFYTDRIPGAEFIAVYAAMLLVLLFKPNGLLGQDA